MSSAPLSTDAPPSTSEVPTTTAPPANTTDLAPSISSIPLSFTQSTGDNGETRVIDDSDPSITYTASGTVPWNATSDTLAYNHTIHQTSCNSCPVTLLFNGTGLSLTSIISPQGSSFLAWIDGAQAGPYSLSNAIEQQATVYTIEGLQNIQHNATFMKASNDTNDGSLFNIDSITIISRPNLGSTSYIPPTPSGRMSDTQTQTGSSPSNTGVPVASSSSPPPVGAIVGGTVGGVALILVVVAWIIIMRRRKSREAEASAASGNRYARDRYAQDGYSQDRYAKEPSTNDRYAKEGYTQDRYARDGYSQDRYAKDGYAPRQSSERYARSGYVDPRYPKSYTSSNNGHSRGYPSSRAASRY